MSDIATPEMIAAAWDAWKSRPGWKLGPGPGFREAIEAALSVRSKEPELEHHVIADLAARLAKAERALEEAKAEIERMTPKYVAYDYLESPARREMAEARVSELERALEEAEKVIKPFAAKSKQFDDACDAMQHPRADDSYRPKTDFTHGHLRTARKWMESRHD